MVRTATITVMFTDLVGSTKLRARLGDDAFDAVRARHDRLLIGAIEEHNGSVAKTLGDGLLAGFDSAADAVAAAVAIQQRVAEDTDISVRIGLNSGEVVVTPDGDYEGMPVVTASRVCDTAEGGQILTTDVVRVLVGSRGNFAFEPLGSREMKGIDGPVAIWEIGTTTSQHRGIEAAAFTFPAVLRRAATTDIVGRAGAGAALDEALHGVESGGRRVILIAGEPGIGKTALTSVWCRQAHDEGAIVLAGRSPSEAVVSYQPFIEVLRQIVVTRPSVLADLGPGGTELARLVPDLAGATGARRIHAEPTTERYLLLEAFVTLLNHLSEEAPVVILLDDLHWADAPSLALLGHLVRHPNEGRVLIVGTYRDTDLSRSHPLAHLLAELRRERLFTRIALDGLSPTEVAEMIGTHGGGAVPDRIQGAIFAETDGNPFFVDEVIAHLIDVGAIDTAGRWTAGDDPMSLGIPEGIREVIGRRLDRLSGGANEALLAAAVVGRNFDLTTVADVARIDIEDAEDAIDEGSTAGLVEEIPDSPGRYTFSHALIQQTLYDELGGARRARLHRRTGEALESADGSAAESSRHWLAAHDLERAMTALTIAADEAEAAFVFDDARRFLDELMEIWDEVEDPETLARLDRATLLGRSAEIRYHTGDDREAVEFAEAALELIDVAAEPTRAGLIHDRIARYLWVLGRTGPAMAAAQEAVRLIPIDPPSMERAQALASVAQLAMLAGREQEAIDLAHESVALAQSVGARQVEGHALNTLGTAEGLLGDFDGARDHISEGRSTAEEVGDIDNRLRSYVNLSEIYDMRGLMEEAIAEALEGAALSSRYGLDYKYGRVLIGNAARSSTRIGQWDGAERLLERQMIGTPSVQAELVLSGVLTELAIERGRFDEARELLARREELGRETGDPQVVGPLARDATRLARLERDPDLALRSAEDGMKQLAGADEPWYKAQLAVEGLGACGDLSASERSADRIESAERLRRFIGDVPRHVRGLEPWLLLAAGEFGRATGESDPETWAAAAEAFDSIPQPFQAAIARWRQAEALAAHGDTRTAALLMSEAIAVATDLRAEPTRKLMVDSAERLGIA